MTATTALTAKAPVLPPLLDELRRRLAQLSAKGSEEKTFLCEMENINLPAVLDTDLLPFSDLPEGFQEVNLNTSFYGAIYRDDIFNIEFSAYGYKWDCIWMMKDMAELCRKFEEALENGLIEDEVTVSYKGKNRLTDNKLVLRNLNGDEPELFLPDVCDTRVEGVEVVATFIFALILNLNTRAELEAIAGISF